MGKGGGGGGPSDSILNRQMDIQQGTLDFSKSLAKQGLAAWQPARDFWGALLQGGPAATQAVGPAAAQLRLQGSGADRTIMSTLPAGGEKNLARAQNVQSTYGNIQRLTQGVQPLAAQNLTTLSGIPLGVSATYSGQGVGLGGPLLGYQSGQNALNAQAAQGVGSLLYNAANKGGGRGGGYYGTPPFVPSSGGGKKS